MTSDPSKGRREPLTREKIIEKALELLDAEGVGALSMRRIGEALDVEAMALYHHFANKDAILDGLAARIMEEAGPAPPLTGADWKTEMASGPAAAGRALQAHPNAGWLFLGRHYGTATSLQMLESPLAILHSAGFRGRELVDAAHAIFAYAAGSYVLTSGEGGPWSGRAGESTAAAAEKAPLATSLASQLRGWSRGIEAGLLALLDGLDARRGK